MTTVNRKEVLLKNLPTRSVTLYPSQALVCREIPDIELKPGANEVTIYGLTPTADEDSIKVDGIGSASVTDMTVNLVDNREYFDQAFPDDEEPEFSDEEEVEDPEADDTPETKTCRKELETLKLEHDYEPILQEAIKKRLEFLADYFGSPKGEELNPSKLAGGLDMYQEEYVTQQQELGASKKRQAELKKKFVAKTAELSKLTRPARVAAAKRQVEKERAKAKAELEKKSRTREKELAREELAKFWPKMVYKVTIHLELSVETPGSSRRTSVSSVTLAKNPDQTFGDPQNATLLLSYITQEASWAPRYDIEFVTSNKTGKVTYRAEYNNHTSETWTDAKISLSTSQTSFHGLDDSVPWMHPWRVGLAKYNSPWGGLTSKQEEQAKAKKTADHTAATSGSSHLGVLAQNINSTIAVQSAKPPTLRSAAPKGLIGGAMRHRKVAASSAMPPPAPSGGLFAHHHHYDPTIEDSAESAMDLGTVLERGEALQAFGSAPAIDFEESTWEDHGLTTTYELPGTRTLEPSSLTRRYKIASLPFSNLVLTSIAVPKLRAAAFLRARFRNPSTSITLLKGTAGLTLDGTFLGMTNLPRVSPNELVTLPLGVDPAIHISYARPSVKRSTQGFINKEAAQLFTRSIIVTNTKTVAADLLLLDQIPVSEDEKLRVEVVQPRGLSREGDTASTGTNAKEGKEKEGSGGKWGKAKATLKKNGEIAYNMTLERGAACRLTLEYEARTPSNDHIVSV